MRHRAARYHKTNATSSPFTDCGKADFTHLEIAKHANKPPCDECRSAFICSVNVFGSSIIDLAIGMTFVYLLLGHPVSIAFPGLALDSVAISLGAPFWFDLSNKFIVVRSTVKPNKKSPAEESKD